MKPNVISLFDESGNALRPWAEAGCRCFALDILNEDKPTERFPSGGSITYICADLRDPSWETWALHKEPIFVMGFPPCTDLAVSGARHFAAKREKNPRFQEEAVELARVVETIGNACGCPWFAENPVSVLSTMWRKSDFAFNPCDYGGYLPKADAHPRWPEYIVPRDAYTKRTHLWTGGGWEAPPMLRVEPVTQTITKADGTTTTGSVQWAKLGGKSAKTKQIRSETPRGFAVANFLTNAPDYLIERQAA